MFKGLGFPESVPGIAGSRNKDSARADFFSLDVIKSKPPELDLVLTGNHAAEEIIELADLVTEMKEIKHPFKSGIKAKKGIDF